MARKPGRNDPCPCGSGRKYKKCHGDSQNPPMPSHVQRQISVAIGRQRAREHEHSQQHGLGRPFVASKFHDHQLVAVGNTIFSSKNWRTVPDFLLSYVRHVLGEDWCQEEIKKPDTHQHPILKWLQLVRAHIAKVSEGQTGVVSAEPTGAALGILWLAYGLYLLQHNAKIQKRLVQRVRSHDPVQFHAALYEIWITSSIVRAGFHIELENEDDRGQTHCEFTATSKSTGKKFSVEAKVCDPGNIGLTRDRLPKQLSRALKKEAEHSRIVFIDLNEPEIRSFPRTLEWLQARAKRLRPLEFNLKEAPPASVFLTNFPYRYHLEATGANPVGIIEGFKIPKLKFDATFNSVREFGDFRETNSDIFQLITTMTTMKIPDTFDGQSGTAVFGKQTNRLLIGNSYLVPREDGTMVEGEFMDGVVNVAEKLVTGIFHTVGNENLIINCPISDEEVKIYRESPETFFGQIREVPKTMTEPIEFYEWCLQSYRDTPKARLLEFMRQTSPDSPYAQLSQEELAKRYCEGLAHQMARRAIRT